MPDINELAEKKLKSRVRKIKKVNKSDEEKEKLNCAGRCAIM